MFSPDIGRGGKWTVGVGVYLMNQSWLLLACSDPVIDGDMAFFLAGGVDHHHFHAFVFSLLSWVSFPELSPPHFSSAPRHPASPLSWLCCPHFLSLSHPSVCFLLSIPLHFHPSFCAVLLSDSTLKALLLRRQSCSSIAKRLSVMWRKVRYKMMWLKSILL